MIKRNKLFPVFAILTVLFSLFITTAIAQNSDSKIIKKKPSANKAKNRGRSFQKKLKRYKTIDRRTPSYQGSRQDDSDNSKQSQDKIKISPKATAEDSKQIENDKPQSSKLIRGGTFNGDLRDIPYVKPELIKYKPKHEKPGANEILIGDPVELGSGKPTDSFAPAPGPLASFVGLDFSTFGSGYPPDTVGDVGPNHFVQAVNGSVGIYDKATGNRLVGLSLNSFMSAGSFGNLCDTANRGDPVVLYDSFEDRWIVTGFAFTTDASGNFTSNSFQCFAASKTGDPVSGGWNYYFTEDTDLFGDYGKFGVWTDGIYMSANMFSFNVPRSFAGVRVRALNKAQMYVGAPTVQVVVFNAPSGEFTMMPGNARLQTGTPPPGTPNLFSVVWQFTNAVSVYKFKVDWEKISTSTFTGPFLSLAPNSWSSPPSTVPAMGGNNNDTLALRLMMQNQYTNIGGVESLWNSHTVRGATAAQSAVRYYQVNVSGGTISAATTQALTHNPDTINRYMPSVAVNRNGDMAIGYSASSSTLPPAIRYAGRLAGDPVNTLPQTETSLIDGPGAQTVTTRWGDYSTTTLDPDGCTFWLTNEYYATVSSNWQTRIGSFALPGCSALSNDGILNGTVTSASGGAPINGATVTLGSRTTSTNASGFYSFTNLPQGTYLTDIASAIGYNSSTATNIVITDANTTTQDFSLTTAPANACLVDTSQSDLQTGIPSNIDLTSNPGDAILTSGEVLDQQNTNVTGSGFGTSSTSWFGQTFTAGATGPLTKVEVDLFCSGCTGTTSNITVSVRATSGDLPTGPDLATATIPGFSSGAGIYYTATFASPATLTSGTQYALVIRPVANPSAGTYAYVVSSGSPYAAGRLVRSSNSGSTWAGTSPSVDIGFRTYIAAGFISPGNQVSSIKDSNPSVSGATSWSSISWSATTPTNTSLSFQVAGSNDPNGPFSFVGPDTTSGTFFTTSGASLSQFNGMRYLKYKAFLATTDSTKTPTLQDVTVCYTNAFESDVAGRPYGNGSYLANDVQQVERFLTFADAIDTSTNEFQRADSAPYATKGNGLIDAADAQQAENYLIFAVSPQTAGGPNSPGPLALRENLSKEGKPSLLLPRVIRAVNVNGSAGNSVAVVLEVDAEGDETGYSFTLDFDETKLSNPVATIGPAGGTIQSVNNPLGIPGKKTFSVRNFPTTTYPMGNNQVLLTVTFDIIVTAPPGPTPITFSGSPTPNSITDAGANTLTGTFTGGTVTILSPTAARISVGGRIFTAGGRAVNRAIVTATNQNGEILTARTNQFGYYRFNEIEVGQVYVFNAQSKGLSFTPQVVNINEQLNNLNFTASPK